MKKNVQHSEWEDNLFESFLQALLPGINKTQDSIVQELYQDYKSNIPRQTKQERVINLTHIEKENLYVEVLYTIKHKIGSTCEGHSEFIEDLYNYAQKAFNMSDKDHRAFLLVASEEKPPIVVLNVEVIQARNLEAKDADGFSDPYIMLGVIPGKVFNNDGKDPLETIERSKTPERSSISSSSRSAKELSKCLGKRSSVSDKNLIIKSGGKDQSKDKISCSKDSIPAKFIQTTSVKENTLNPVWNETFHFDIDNIQYDKLHLDIWDHDDEENVFDAVKRFNQVRGVKGLTRYFKQVGQSARNTDGDVDDFLGCLSIDLDNIPSIGRREWFYLEGRSGKSRNVGEIELDIKLSTKECRNLSVEGNWLDVLQHEDLLRIFIKYELQCCQKEPRSWNGEIREAAETILHQHAIQGDITKLQLTICRWLAMSEFYVTEELDPEVLINILDNMENSWQQGELSRDEMSLLATSYKKFVDHCLDDIKVFRYKFPAYIDKSVHDLQQTLRMLASISSSNIYRSVCPFEDDLSSQQIVVIKSSAAFFVDSILAKCKQEKDNSGTGISKKLDKYLQLVKAINQDLFQLEDFYHDIFAKESKLKLFPLTYKVYNHEIEKLLFQNNFVANLPEQLAILTGDLNTITSYQSFLDLFSLYSNLEQFYSYQDVLITDDYRSFELLDYQSWFLSILSKWMIFMKQKLEQYIEYQIDVDELKYAVDDNSHWSTSAIKVVNTFETIGHIWRKLQWIDIEEKKNYVSQFMKVLGSCSRLYADVLHEKIRLEGYFDECGQFDLSYRLCLALNDISRIDLCLSRSPVDFVFDAITSEVISSTGDKATGKAFRDSLLAITTHSRDHISAEIGKIIQRVTGKMRPDIRKNIVHLCWSPQSVHIEQASYDLLTYIFDNISTIKKQLHVSIVSRVILSVWNEVLSQVLEQASKEFFDNQESRDDLESWKFVFIKLDQCLCVLLDSFTGVDENITMSQLNTEYFKNLKYLLLLYQSKTSEIMELYFKEKQSQQDNNDSSGQFGFINMKVYYRRKSELLVVDVISASNLAPLDSNGLSDPFVTLELVPSHFFNNPPKAMKTKIIKKSLNPEFNEVFEIPVRCCDLGKSRATLVVTVLDHDMLVTDDLEGLVFLDLSNIAGIDSVIEDPSSVDPMRMPLMRPRFEENRALSVLNSLKSDIVACEFVKKWMPLEKR